MSQRWLGKRKKRVRIVTVMVCIYHLSLPFLPLFIRFLSCGLHYFCYVEAMSYRPSMSHPLHRLKQKKYARQIRRQKTAGYLKK